MLDKNIGEMTNSGNGQQVGIGNIYNFFETPIEERLKIKNVDDFLFNFLGDLQIKDWIYIDKTNPIWIFSKDPFVKLKMKEISQFTSEDLYNRVSSKIPNRFITAFEKEAFSELYIKGSNFFVKNIVFEYYGEPIYEDEVVNIHGKLDIPLSFLHCPQSCFKKIFQLINVATPAEDVRAILNPKYFTG